jgi:hypothetical protein
MHLRASFLAGLGQRLGKVLPIYIVQAGVLPAILTTRDARPTVASPEAEGASRRDIERAVDAACRDGGHLEPVL